ncbi:MAG: alginate export family protein [bacterium]
MRFRYLAVLLLISLMAAPRASAEMRLTKRFSLDAETRYRSEIVDKDFNPDTGFNEFSALRTHLGATFVASRNVTLRFKIKETRYLGTTPSLTASSATLSFQEAYVKLDNALGSPLSLRFGRFEAAYGRNRIMGQSDWQNYGPSAYDGVLVELKTESGWWNVFYSKIAEGSFLEGDPLPLYDLVSPVRKGDRHLTAFTGSMAKDLIQPLVMIDLDERLLNGIKKNNVITTAAVSSIYKSNRFAFEGDGAYQLGTVNDRDLSSWLVSVDLSYSLSAKIRPKFGLGADVTSGNKFYEDDSSYTDHVFYSPFGSRHIFKGYIDYFVDETSFFERQGLIDSYLRFSFQPGSRYGIELTGHNFAFMENAFVDGIGFSPVAQEIDTRLIAVLARGFEFQVGYSVFLPSEKYASFIGQPDKKMGQFIYITIVGKL